MWLPLGRAGRRERERRSPFGLIGIAFRSNSFMLLIIASVHLEGVRLGELNQARVVCRLVKAKQNKNKNPVQLESTLA